MTEFIDFLSKGSNLSSFGIALAIFYMGFKRTWVWGYQLEDQKSLTAKAEATAAKWEAAYLSTVGLAETTAAIVKART